MHGLHQILHIIKRQKLKRNSPVFEESTLRENSFENPTVGFVHPFKRGLDEAR